MDNANRPGNRNQSNSHQTREKGELSDRTAAGSVKEQSRIKERESPKGSLLNMSPDPIVIIQDQYFQVINPAFSNLFGYTPRDVNNKLNFFDLIPEHEREAARVRYGQYLKGGRLPGAFRIDLCSKDGEAIPCEISVARLIFKGRPMEMMVIRNITGRPEEEKELRENEEIFQLLSEQSHPGIAIVKNKSVEYVNKALADIFELPFTSIPALTPEHFQEIIHPDDISNLKQRILGEENNDQEEDRSYSFRIVTKTGREKWLDLVYKPVSFRGEEAGLITVHDISERKKIEEEKAELEARLRQALKLEAVGTLAGGMAHDFNNILQAVSGYSQLVLFNTDPEDSNYERLKRIESSAHKAAELIKKLLTFSRKIESKKQPTNLNQEVEEVQTFLTRTIPKMIEIDLHLAEDLKKIDADSIQLEQILVNLCLNARDAMPAGGRITFKTANFTLDDGADRPHPEMVPGDYVLLSISDTGCGMEEEALNHIFEPFFTTKEAGEGTGLGLAMVSGIVQSHNGFIMCQSEIGQGTVFTIYFPTLDRKPAPVMTQSEKKALLEGNETVLVVDDEEAIRVFIEEALSRFGYRVLTVPDGEEAVWLYAQLEDQIDLVILDLNMPGMGGEPCLYALLKRNPEANIIITSGYAPTEEINEMVESKAQGFIGKPFDIVQLLEKVRNVLDEKNAAGNTDPVI